MYVTIIEFVLIIANNMWCNHRYLKRQQMYMYVTIMRYSIYLLCPPNIYYKQYNNSTIIIYCTTKLLNNWFIVYSVLRIIKFSWSCRIHGDQGITIRYPVVIKLSDISNAGGRTTHVHFVKLYEWTASVEALTHFYKCSHSILLSYSWIPFSNNSNWSHK